jgi:hemerythrin-like metal-binding protein
MLVHKWSDSYKLGNEEIDSEHRRLMELLGWLEEKLYREENLDFNEIQNVVSELNIHVGEHFHHEESMMKNLSSMPASEKIDHEADHRIWFQKLTELLPSLMSAKTDLERRAYLARILLIGKAFWAEHFIEFDTKLAKFVNVRK